MKIISKLLGIGFLFSAFTWATPVTTWDVVANFLDGRQTDTVTGNFTIDSSFNFISWDITVAGPDANSYKNGDGNSDTPILSDNNHYLVFEDSQFGPGVALFLNTALPSGSGSPITLGAGTSQFDANVCSFFCFNGGDTFVSGTLTDAPPAPTPEPASVAFCLPAIIGMALLVRRRKLASNQ